MTLSVLADHSLIASVFKCKISYLLCICRASYSLHLKSAVGCKRILTIGQHLAKLKQKKVSSFYPREAVLARVLAVVVVVAGIVWKRLHGSS